MESSNKAGAAPELLFERLDDFLGEHINDQYFSDPRDFRSLVEVLSVLDEKVDKVWSKGDELLAALKEENPAYNRLLDQRKIVYDVIEEVVKFQQGGLNNTVETMSSVIKEYNSGREDIRGLRQSLAETEQVLTARKSGQLSMKEMWLKKVEAEESLRILRDLEYLKDATPRIHRLVVHRHYYSAVSNLNRATELMFGEDLVEVQGLSLVHEQLMEMKGDLLERLVLEMQDAVLGNVEDWAAARLQGRDDVDDQDTRSASQSVSSYYTGVSGTSLAFGSPTSPFQSVPTLSTALMFRRPSTCTGTAEAPSSDGGSSSGVNAHRLDVSDLFNDQPWSLMGVNEEMEASLVDDGAFKGDLTHSSVFIRLMVRSAGLLGVEEDVERMMLDGAKLRYREVVRKLRDLCLIQKTQLAAAVTSLSSSGGNGGFSASNSGGTGDSIERGDGWLPQPANRSGQQDSDGGVVAAAVNEALFTVFVQLLLRSALDILKRVLYVLSLLQSMRKHREAGATASGDGKAEDGPRGASSVDAASHAPLSDSNKAAVLELWREIETCVIEQLFAHFSEQVINDISDTGPSVAGVASGEGALAMSKGVPGDNKSSGSGAAVTRSSFHSESDGGQEDEEDVLHDHIPIFQPSYSLAAPAYSVVQAFSDEACDIFSSQGIAYTNLDVNNNSSTSGSEDGQAGPSTRLLQRLSAFLRDELVPLIQLNANASLRDVQLNGTLFATPVSSTDKEELKSSMGTGLGTDVMGIGQEVKLPKAISKYMQRVYGREGGGDIGGQAPQYPQLLTAAAAKCYLATRPLFNYWLQLPLHATMLVTVFERQLQGFVSSAKEEVERLTCGWQSSQKDCSQALLAQVKADPYYKYYLQNAFASGGAAPSELLEAVSGWGNRSPVTSSSRGTSPTSPRGSGKRTASKEGAEYVTGNSPGEGDTRPDSDTSPGKAAFELWEPLWDRAFTAVEAAALSTVAPGNAPISTTSSGNTSAFTPCILQNFQEARDLAHLAHTCQWVAHEIVCSFAASVATAVGDFKTQYSSVDTDVGDITPRAAGAYASLQQRNAFLYAAVNSAVGDLAAVAERALALLRGEAQVACVVMLAQFSREMVLNSDSCPTAGYGNSATAERESIVASQRISSRVSNSVTDGNNVDRTEAAEVVALIAFLNAFKDTLQQAMLPVASDLTLAPLKDALPALLMRCVKTRYDAHHVEALGAPSTANSPQKKTTPFRSISSPSRQHHTPSKGTKPAEVITSTTHARLLKTVVSFHKALSLLLDSHQQAPRYRETHKGAHQSLAEEVSLGFDKVRHYLAMLDMGPAELAAELQSEINRRDYAKEELYTLWQRVQWLQRNAMGRESGSGGGDGEREQFEALWRNSG